MEKQTVKPGRNDIGSRLDVYLAGYFFKKHSRTSLQKLIADKCVTVNGSARKPNYRLGQGDTIEVSFPELKPTGIEPQDIPLNILYEDDDLIVVDKPAGMVTHPGAGVKNGTLVNALLHHCGKLSGEGAQPRPGIVHRLDKDTSGVMVAAKNDVTHRGLAAQFKKRGVQRRYVALVSGVVEFDNGRIDLPIGRHPSQREKMAVAYAGSKEAVTEYRVIKRLEDATLLYVMPVTGRTHQIRVHLKALGHPVLGDAKYGAPADRARYPRQMLHAEWIRFFHPTLKKYMEFSSKAPF